LRFIFEKLGFRAKRPKPELPAFPSTWQEFLNGRYQHYRRLPSELRSTFNAAVQHFLHSKRITGIEVEVNDELKLLVAASAVTLSFQWEGYDWRQLAEVLLYPDHFDRDFNFGGTERAGTVDHWGTVILSVPALRQSFGNSDIAYHVGLHEFAHLLDLEASRTDGIPPGLNSAQTREWVQMQQAVMEDIRLGRSVLSPYGMSHEVEFFAVAVETFFQTPIAMRTRHDDLYSFLARYFDQDPAAWEDRRAIE